jgi:hypothetical protein
MAAGKKKKKRSSGKSRGGAGPGQKLAVALASIVLVLCAASVTFSFFVRHRTDNGRDGVFTIEVLNGTGKAGLANEAKKGLLRRGIDVIAVANAERFDYPESVLISRKRNADVGMLGEILGCKNVIVQIREDSIEDASLILGADYRDLNLEWDDD